MISFAIYDTGTGLVKGVFNASDASAMVANTPPGCAALELTAGQAPIGNGWQVVGGVLPQIVPTAAELLTSAQAAQSAAIQVASTVAQSGGFTSSALGSAYTYPSAPQDQANLIAVATASNFPGRPAGETYLFWCTSANGVSNFVAHSAAQIQQVGIDGLNAIMAVKSKAYVLSLTIATATTVAAVQAIVWES
ncbi:MAG: hypothetical protein ABI072_09445 [Edaphobacter sp.]